MTINLLQETIEMLLSQDLTPDDVKWVGTSDGTETMTWEQFLAAADVNYYDGYGSNEIRDDLVVVGADWWLERGEYDGSEWWEFKRLPTPQVDAPLLGTVWDKYYLKYKAKRGGSDE